jgi:hypothetical protein
LDRGCRDRDSDRDAWHLDRRKRESSSPIWTGNSFRSDALPVGVSSRSDGRSDYSDLAPTKSSAPRRTDRKRQSKLSRGSCAAKKEEVKVVAQHGPNQTNTGSGLSKIQTPLGERLYLLAREGWSTGEGDITCSLGRTKTGFPKMWLLGCLRSGVAERNG